MLVTLAILNASMSDSVLRAAIVEIPLDDLAIHSTPAAVAHHSKKPVVSLAIMLGDCSFILHNTLRRVPGISG